MKASEKCKSFWVADVEDILSASSYKLKIFFLKIEYEEELRISVSNAVI